MVLEFRDEIFGESGFNGRVRVLRASPRGRSAPATSCASLACASLPRGNRRRPPRRRHHRPRPARPRPSRILAPPPAPRAHRPLGLHDARRHVPAHCTVRRAARPGGVDSVMSPQLALCEVSSHGLSSGGFCRAELTWRELSSHRASRTQRAPVRLTPTRHLAPTPELARRRIMSSSSFSSPRPRRSPTTPARPFTSAPRTRNRRPGAARSARSPGNRRDRRVTAEIVPLADVLAGYPAISRTRPARGTGEDWARDGPGPARLPDRYEPTQTGPERDGSRAWLTPCELSSHNVSSARAMRAQLDKIHLSSILASSPRTMRAEVTSPNRLPQGARTGPRTRPERDRRGARKGPGRGSGPGRDRRGLRRRTYRASGGEAQTETVTVRPFAVASSHPRGGARADGAPRATQPTKHRRRPASAPPRLLPLLPLALRR